MPVTLQTVSTSRGTGTRGPLEDMAKPIGVAATLKYPEDLGTSTKNHYVKFSVKKIIPSGASVVGGQKTTEDKEGTTVVLFGQKLVISPQTTKPEAYIALYMPDTLNASYEASYDELSLTSDLGGALKAVQQISTAIDVGGDKNAQSALGAEAGKIKTIVDAITATAKGLGIDVNSDTIGDVALKGAGYAINPQLQMIYRGIAFRHFQLVFNFTPKNANEAETVRQILFTFKYHFAPDLLAPGVADTGMFFIPPSLFNIEFMFGAHENIHLPKYGDCVLTDMDINYTPNGFASYKDGAPVQTQLTLTFKEIEIVTKQKLEAGKNEIATAATTGILR